MARPANATCTLAHTLNSTSDPSSDPQHVHCPLLQKQCLMCRSVGTRAGTGCWAARASVLVQVRRTEDALRAAPGNATLRMLLWYQVRVLLPAHALRHAAMRSART